MAEGRHLVLYGVWLLSAAAIAIVAGLFAVTVVGLADLGSRSATVEDVLFAVVAVVVFAGLAALPWLLRRRTTR